MFLGLAALFGLYGLTLGSPGPIVDTPLGRVLGWERSSRDGRTYQAFTGVPFAQPPVGELRFKAPRPVERWEGVLNATGEIPTCIQSEYGSFAGTEDCLYLNVYRPKNPAVRRMPVLFFLYGGGFSAGTVGCTENADYLMDEDVILVSTNYRVGILGFGSLADKEFPGNFGVKDAVQALRWIQQNIEAFGGDPESVTVFGLSAGAHMTHHLLKSPLTEREHLITRALSDSGTINHGSALMNASAVAVNTRQAAIMSGCNQTVTEELLACLRKVDAATLVKNAGSLRSKVVTQLSFAPVIEPEDAEDAVIPEDLTFRPTRKPFITRFSNGEWVTMYQGMNGSISQEWWENVANNITGYLEDYVSQYTTDAETKSVAAYLLKEHYFSDTSDIEKFKVEYAKFTGDNGFTYPAIFAISAHTGPRWISRFEYHSKALDHGSVVDDTVAGHAEERFYYFNDPPRTMEPADLAMSKKIIKFLVNFAYFSDPTPPGSETHWPQVTPEKFNLLRTTAEGDILADDDVVQQLKTVEEIWYYAIGWK